jgi:NACHT domain
MAEILGITSGIAGLIGLAMEITRLSYGYISDIRLAHTTQKQYLREMSALTEVLLRSEEATGAFENQTAAVSQPMHFSKSAIRDCAKELEDLRSELEKPSPSIFWPLKEKALQKRIKSIHQFRSIFSGFLTAQTLVAVSATHREVTRLGHHHEQLELLDWIGNPKDTSGPVLSPIPGTGDWFAKSDAYQNWVVGNGSSLLWCHGPPGVGKSMLASIALQHLSETLDGSLVSLVYYFCDFANRKEQKKEAIWKSLLRQAIAQRQLPVLEALASSRAQLNTLRPASAKDLSNALNAICSSGQVILVFDAPDELENAKELESILHPFLRNNCRILVTSRDLPEIRSVLNMASIVEVQADRNDLRTYVVSQFEENDLGDLLEKHPELQIEIVDKSNGMWVINLQISLVLTNRAVSCSRRF